MKKALVICGILASSLSCHADIEVSGALSGFQFQLVDLDLTDGVSPSLTFTLGTFGLATSQGIVRITAPDGVSDQLSVSTAVPFTGFARSMTRGELTGEITLVNSSLDDLGLATRVHSSLDSTAPLHRSTGTSAYTSWAADFVLSANTKLTIVGEAKLAADSSVSVDPRFNTSVFSKASISASTVDAYGVDSLEKSLASAGGEFAFSDEKSLTVAVFNNSAESRNVSLSAYVTSIQSVSAVPEPATLWAAVSGVLFLSLIRRRRLTRWSASSPAAR